MVYARFFDDGQPLGSASNTECRIDSIPQSWAVLSGARPDRAIHSRDASGRFAPGQPRSKKSSSYLIPRSTNPL